MKENLNGEMLNSASFLEMIGKFFTSEFTSSVESEDDDLASRLNLEPCLIFCVMIEDF